MIYFNLTNKDIFIWHYIDEDERAIIRGAFSHWQQQTCLKFKELGINEPYSSHYILVTRQPTG